MPLPVKALAWGEAPDTLRFLPRPGVTVQVLKNWGVSTVQGVDQYLQCAEMWRCMSGQYGFAAVSLLLLGCIGLRLVFILLLTTVISSFTSE